MIGWRPLRPCTGCSRRIRPLSITDATQTSLGAPWSVPVSVEQAIFAGALPALITIESVEHHEAPSWYEITFATTFILYALDDLPVYRVKIAFECGDARLLQEGAEWLGVFVVDQPSDWTWQQDPISFERLFLVPGVLLPNVDYNKRVILGLH